MEKIRKMHNTIKYNLLKNAVKELRMNDENRKIVLLDLGVGRANDVNKWNSLNITTIIGIDSSEDQLNFAKERIQNNKNVLLYNVDLSNIDDINFKLDDISKKKYEINLVVSFFSIHYFYLNLNKILSKFNLSNDCIFLATFMNIYYGYLHLDNNDQVENELIYLEKINNNKIIINFKDTPYFKKGDSIENIVESNKLSSFIVKNFPNIKVKSFLEEYDDINNLDLATIEIELIHQFIIAKK